MRPGMRGESHAGLVRILATAMLRVARDELEEVKEAPDHSF